MPFRKRDPENSNSPIDWDEYESEVNSLATFRPVSAGILDFSKEAAESEVNSLATFRPVSAGILDFSKEEKNAQLNSLISLNPGIDMSYPSEYLSESQSGLHVIPFTKIQESTRIESMTAEIDVVKKRVTEMEERGDSNDKEYKQFCKELNNMKRHEKNLLKEIEKLRQNKAIFDKSINLLIDKAIKTEEEIRYLKNRLKASDRWGRRYFDEVAGNLEKP